MATEPFLNLLYCVIVKISIVSTPPNAAVRMNCQALILINIDFGIHSFKIFEVVGDEKGSKWFLFAKTHPWEA